MNNYFQVIRGGIINWPAIGKWSITYFMEQTQHNKLPFKRFVGQTVEKHLLTLKQCMQRPDQMYLHDVPLLHYFPKLRQDIGSLPCLYLPKWYDSGWHDFSQFFVGKIGCRTPLHFDCLLTYNMFFHIFGRKKFLLIDAKYQCQLQRRDWRWFNIDENEVTLKNNLKQLELPYDEIVLVPGDMLIMKPGTLHTVECLTDCISFNIDFHTKLSVLQSFKGLFKGMPIKNTLYNFLILLGLFCRIPRPILFKYYRSYLNYVS